MNTQIVMTDQMKIAAVSIVKRNVESNYSNTGQFEQFPSWDSKLVSMNVPAA